MQALYKEHSANAPRMSCDRLFYDENASARYEGILEESFRFVEDFQLLDGALWARFVEQFRAHTDTDAGWRGEYWGKMMRGGAFVYAYTKNPSLYAALKNTVADMLSVAEADGRISSYPREREFDGWDLWSRKYVLLGMQYFLEICEDGAFADRVTDCMKKQVDYLIARIGKKSEGKRQITTATRHWRGLNSASLLEPIVRLYSLTGESRYFDFATYIVEEGGTDVVNIFTLAEENELAPYQYPVTKAYEMTSCFEGLLEYYRLTKKEGHRQALVNFAERILKEDFTVIGCAGCTHELFDHSAVRQANTTNGDRMQETCVTVTLMKFFYQMHLLTGDVRYADAFEISLYNAYLGSINFERAIEPTLRAEYPDIEHFDALPFSSYSPLTAATRGQGVGGLKRLPDGSYYGCCACIGAAGIGLVPRMHTLLSERGILMNLFIGGTLTTRTPSGQAITFSTETRYPSEGDIKITLSLETPERFLFSLRNPAWNRMGTLFLNGKKIYLQSGYTEIERTWQTGDTLVFTLDMRTALILPTPYGEQLLMNKVIWGKNYMIPTFDREDPLARRHRAFRRGPILLAEDERLGYSCADAISYLLYADATLACHASEKDVPFRHIVAVDLPQKNGETITLVDYASAGKTYAEEYKMAAWILTE